MTTAWGCRGVDMLNKDKSIVGETAQALYLCKCVALIVIWFLKLYKLPEEKKQVIWGLGVVLV
jgi:hypothetical protein